MSARLTVCGWCKTTLIPIIRDTTICPHCDYPCARGNDPAVPAHQRCDKCRRMFPEIAA